MIEDFDADVTPRLLTAMADSFARTRFLLETGPSHRLNDQLDARALDVIVAEDNKTNQLVLKKFLQDQDITLEMVNNGAELVAAFRDGSPPDNCVGFWVPVEPASLVF